MTKTKPNTAELIKDVSSNFQGDAQLYKLSKPVSYEDTHFKRVDGKTEWDTRKSQTKFVVVSSISAAPDHGGSETFIFPADSNGVVQNWSELQGSQRGNASAFLVLGGLGYTLK
jgi:hypothetical protein